MTSYAPHHRWTTSNHCATCTAWPTSSAAGGSPTARTWSPVKALLHELGDPHLGRVTVHIAGSKGKGSVAAMVESMVRAAGYRTGLFTSPHLHRFPERIQTSTRAHEHTNKEPGDDSAWCSSVP